MTHLFSSLNPFAPSEVEGQRAGRSLDFARDERGVVK